MDLTNCFERDEINHRLLSGDDATLGAWSDRDQDIEPPRDLVDPWRGR
jgi:hypothetical protein